MTRIVVIASSEPSREALADVVAPDDEVHVVIAAVEQSRLQWLANDEDEARRDAERVGRTIRDDAPASPTSIEVKPEAPSQLVADAIGQHDPDRIVVMVRQGEDATWLERAELDRLPSEIQGVPVTRVAV